MVEPFASSRNFLASALHSSRNKIKRSLHSQSILHKFVPWLWNFIVLEAVDSRRASAVSSLMNTIPGDALILTNEPVLNGSILQAILSRFGLSLEAVSLITASKSVTTSLWRQGAFSTVVSLSQASGIHDVAFLGLLSTTLRPGGKLIVIEPPV